MIFVFETERSLLCQECRNEVSVSGGCLSTPKPAGRTTMFCAASVSGDASRATGWWWFPVENSRPIGGEKASRICQETRKARDPCSNINPGINAAQGAGKRAKSPRICNFRKGGALCNKPKTKSTKRIALVKIHPNGCILTPQYTRLGDETCVEIR